MKDKFTIGEFAKLKNITSETLRYYDRIGLLKPIKTDEKTGYRYYSILQYERLSTILELRQLGMSIEEIIKYFDNRNLNQSLNILKQKYDELEEKIKELKALEKSTKEKIKHLEYISKVDHSEEIIIKNIEKRYVITFDREIFNEVELNYSYVELENELNEIAPIVGSNRYGAIIGEKSSNNIIERVFKLFLFIDDTGNMDENKIKIIPKGDYVCMYYKGFIWDISSKIEKLIKFIEKENYEICGDIIEIVQIDISVTDIDDEELFEIQIPVRIN
ncbi:TPA: MerR family transcriptional regulator [Clostridium perfringens]